MVALKAIIPLCLATLATTAPNPKRNLITADTLIADIKGIDTGVNLLSKDTAAFNGGLLAQAPFTADLGIIEIANRKGYADANLRLTPFSDADSTKIVEYTIETVGKDIPASIEVLKSKAGLFKKMGETEVILASLKLLLYDHDTFSAALTPKLTADLERGQQVVDSIHDAIQGGIDYLNSS